VIILIMVRVDFVKFGEVKIDGKIYYSDMTVWWDGKVEYRNKSHTFGMSEFLKLLERKPDIVVFGTGLEGICRILEEVEQTAKDKGVEIFREVSPKAAEMFNAFISDKKKVVAVLHSTC